MVLKCRAFGIDTQLSQSTWSWGSDKDYYQGVVKKEEIVSIMSENGQQVLKLMNGGKGVDVCDDKIDLATLYFFLFLFIKFGICGLAQQTQLK